MIIDPAKVSIQQFHQLLLGAVAPRPIAFASTIDKEGNVNLSPFSFFNCFSANPPILIFSPARRVRDNTIKHTLENVYEIKEVVINVVNFNLVEQSSLASTEYDKGVNEFVKAGLTATNSIIVKPPRIKESPVSFECKVDQIIALGDQKGAGNLIICEVLLAHCKEEIFSSNGSVDPNKIDLVARMGGNYYCRASGSSVFEIPKPLERKGIGVDALPENIRNSKILSGNNLGRLGNLERLPGIEECALLTQDQEVKNLLQNDPSEEGTHRLAKRWIESGRVWDACKLLLLKKY